MTATIGTDCGCSGTAAMAGGPVSAQERTRYYPRQLVSAADLTQDQLYFGEKSRRHNRMLHGWGIVCGARVRASSAPGSVDIEPGYILGPFGDEIMIDQLITIDLTSQNLDGDAANGCIPADPWCADVKVSRPADQPVYLAIAYAEFACRPVQAATSSCGCGCEETACEYSRYRDSYRIRVLGQVPDTDLAVMSQPPLQSCFHWAGDGQPCDCPTCSPCPSEPWVILADITMNGTDITKIDCDSHRRYVASFRDYFYLCETQASPKPGPGRLFDLFKPSVVDQLAQQGVDLPVAVFAQPATNLNVDISPASVAAKNIAALTVAQVANMPRDQFIAQVTRCVRGAAAASAAKKAAQLWDHAIAARDSVIHP